MLQKFLSRQPNTSCLEYNIQSTSYDEIIAKNSKYNQYNLISIHSIKALLCTIYTLPASPWPHRSRWSPHIAKSIKPSNTYHNSHTFTISLFELWTTFKPINLTFNLFAQQSINTIYSKLWWMIRSCATSNGKKIQKHEARASAQARISTMRSQLLLYPNSPSLQLQKKNLSMLLPKIFFAIAVDNRNSTIPKPKNS